MNKKIKPVLLNINKDESWQEDQLAPFGSRPDIRWVVHYEVRLADGNASPSIWNRIGFGRGGVIGELFGFTVCSPSFKDRPEESYSQNDLSRALIQERFDEHTATEYLKSRILEVGESTVLELGERLAQFLETDEWEHSLNEK
jgi:hypothetical protein